MQRGGLQQQPFAAACQRLVTQLNALAVKQLETKPGGSGCPPDLQFAQLQALVAQLLQQGRIDLRRRQLPLQFQQLGLLGLDLLQPRLGGLGLLPQFVTFTGQAGAGVVLAHLAQQGSCGFI